MPLEMLLIVLLGVTGGAVASTVLLPAWAPALTVSLIGPEPKAYWYLSRSSAFVAYGLLWVAMIFGLLMTSKTARLWPGGPTAYDVHQHTSLLGLAFSLLHALVLLGDRYIGFTLGEVLTPFGGAYERLWVGLGQIGFYGLAAVALSFYVREQIGRAAWRAIHIISFGVFALALLHGITSGSDSGSGWAGAIYWTSSGSVLFLTIYRALMAWGRGERRLTGM
ncbi:MAG: hypothetical protein RLZZ387_5460 [Chloroflexota bacterium]|jgi:predicted ferric reductase